ncbi:hypothetical protein PFICI_02683 [Pestalotiopsis fici W106-1]|uniref:Calpain catalytic domain-containing protein n=1 Tax=Pestalotiopsis fici (strain W106-1 / CGMCC3.15140) TaxID=1229662 RepID=W3XEY0_PESFW|nr:uncharacterized protein PFICI_02683 [Pestalotiopsis fici W106-1]ETS84658.1 hypothetical protein PFICI_02683 [Pestalotiopsis fici W106-1]
MSVRFPLPSAAAYLDRDDYTTSTDSGSDEEPVRRRPVIAQVPVVLPKMPRKKQQAPQDAIDEFWSKFNTKTPGKATTVIPHNSYIRRAAKHARKTGITTKASYEEAAEVCKAKVSKIVKECRRINQKYRDPHFDLEWDLKWGKRDTLETLHNVKDPDPSEFKPKSVKRVPDIFDNPQFYIDGPTASDVRQGRDGDCWLMAALCTLSNKPRLIERCCVARDEQVGVYGFVFHRDGEWISEIIDDKLFLTKPDFEESFLERMLWEDRERVESEEQYRKAYQSGSGALYFAQCVHPDETWLPLLEKAYAKAHGDYAAIEGGFTGEGIEDLTGGVTSEIYTKDILDKEYFWKEELMKVNDEFLFGCSTGMWGIGWGDRRGIVELHAYSIMKAVEIDGHRLLLLKNPWGKGEWKGPWSDGSKEWTAEWLVKLNHRFGDDGAFWISYSDLLRKFQAFDRTRLFNTDWKITSLWTTLPISWTLDYHETLFAFSITKTRPVVIVLSQLDDRYYQGLEGQYSFTLNFRLHKAGQEDYVVRTISPYCQRRSVNVELELGAGDYTVLLKVNATRDMDILPIEEVVRNNARERRDKLVAVGMSYDLAHGKGVVIETREEKEAKKEAEKRKREKEKKELREKLMEQKERTYYFQVKELNKRRERRARAKAKAELKKAQKAQQARQVDAVVETKPSNTTPSKATEKHVQIQTPSPTTPVPDEAESKHDSGRESVASDSSSDTSFRTPSTGSGESSLEVAEVPERFQAKIAAADTENPTKSPEEAVQSPPSPPEKVQTAEKERSLGEDKTALDQKAASEPTRAIANCPKCATIQPESEDDSSSDESDISSVSDISDRVLEYQLDSRPKPPPPPPAQPPVPHPAEPEDEFESNPWNAMATVGLRVYYKGFDDDKDDEIVKLKVVRSIPHAERHSNKDKPDNGDAKDIEVDKDTETVNSDDRDGAGGEVELGLDVDDSAKDATLVGDPERRRKSIVPA